MLTYRLYGLTLQSDWRLPCPRDVESGVSEIRLQKAPPQFFQTASQLPDQGLKAPRIYRYLPLQDGSTYLCWPNLFEFLISPDGREIAGHPLSATPAESFQTYLLGHVLSFAMLRQGIEHYHCSAVVVNGGAVCFLGNCGYGKSTLAAGFLSAGYSLLSDDILVMTPGPGSDLYAYPGTSRLKLFPAISRKVLRSSQTGTPMNPMTRKLIIGLESAQICRKAVPVRAIYALNPPNSKPRGDRVTIRRLSPKRALLKVIEGTFNNYVTDPDRLRNQFLVSNRIAAMVPVKSICYPRTLRGLASAREAILADLSRLA